MIEVKCPICNKKIKIPLDILNRKLKCPKCKASLEEVKRQIVEDVFSQFNAAQKHKVSAAIRPPWLHKLFLGVGIFILVFCLGTFLFIKNRWETKHYENITDLAKTGEQYYHAKDYSHAIATYDELFSLVGDRKMKSDSLRTVIDEARGNYADSEIQYENSICDSLQPLFLKAREFFQKGGNAPTLSPNLESLDYEIQASVQKWGVEESLSLYQSLLEKMPDRHARGEKLKNMVSQIEEDIHQLEHTLAMIREQEARRAEEESKFKPAMQKFLKEISPLAQEFNSMNTRWQGEMNYDDYKKATYHLVLAYENCRSDSYAYNEQRAMMECAEAAIRKHKLAVTYWGYILEDSGWYDSKERDACREKALEKGGEFVQDYNRYQHMYGTAEKSDMDLLEGFGPRID